MRLPLFALALASAFLVQLPAAHAEWNRRISDIRIVHPPGSPPGTWRVDVQVGAWIDPNTPTPAPMDFDIYVDLNGTIISTTHVPLGYQNGPSCASGSSCANSPCAGWNNGGIGLSGNCGWEYFPSTGVYLCGCNCNGVWYDFGPWPTGLVKSDVIGVTLVATGLSETETADDSRSLAVVDNPIGTSFCFGDGSTSTPCPCANTGAAGHGCANSADANGALLEANGWTQPDPATGTDCVVLHGSHMTATSTAIYLKGSSANPGAVVFGDGLRCTAGALIRLRVKSNVGGASHFPEAGDPPLSVAGGTPPGSGVTATYQVYYRDPASYCTALTYNITNAVSLDW